MFPTTRQIGRRFCRLPDIKLDSAVGDAIYASCRARVFAGLSLASLNRACPLRPKRHRQGLASCTKSSMTAFASWRGVTVPVSG